MEPDIDKQKQKEEILINRCLNKDSFAQQELYKTYAFKMYPVCVKMARNQADIDDLLQEGFIKVFSYLKNFRNEGSFEGWIRRIMVNSALNYYKRKRLAVKDIDLEQTDYVSYEKGTAIDQLSLQEIESLIKDLPNGYKKVFTLSMIEGYSHKEIGERLNISVNTSKSQLTRARLSLRKKLEDHNISLLSTSN